MLSGWSRSQCPRIIHDHPLQGVPVLQYSTTNGPLRFREISDQEVISSQPFLRDPYEARLVEVRQTTLFSAVDIL